MKILITLFYFFSVASIAQTTAFVGTDKSVNLFSFMEIAEDSKVEYTLQDLAEIKWQSTERESFSPSFSDSAFWLKGGLVNQTSQRLVLSLDQPLQDHIQLWLLDQSGQIVEQWRTGDRLEFSTRGLKTRHFSFRFNVEQGELYQVVIRFNTHDGLYDPINISLEPEDLFWSKYQLNLTKYASFFGALLSLLFYNFLIGVVRKDKDFFLYSFYLAGIGGALFTANGFTSQLVLQNAPAAANQILPILTVMAIWGMFSFITQMIGAKSSCPRLYKIARVLAIALFLPFTTSFMDWYGPTYVSLIPLILLMMVTLLAITVLTAKQGNNVAKLILVAWGVLLTSIFSYFLMVVNVLPVSLHFLASIEVATAIEFILLSLILAYKLNIMEKAKLKAESEALSLERKMKRDLEAKVAERTEELRWAKEAAELAARTDELTQLFNRRGFFELALQLFKKSNRYQTNLCLISIDIDRFKKVNDQFGHDAGDQVLKDVGLQLKLLLRDSDIAGRLGGEEFCILLPETDIKGAGELANRIREHFDGRQINTASGLVSITLSVGVSSNEDSQLSLEESLLRSDAMLYQAKTNGRNRVEIG